ncbi:hypothetical protein RCL1_004655 [Eukaryota sp. TZLM3-RCL]
MTFDPTQRYDRQIRLWGAHGQFCLTKSSVLVIGSTVAASETIKNLVLPGIGSVFILDNTIVTENDIDLDFFIQPSDVGKLRSSCLCEGYRKLNPNVEFTALNEDPNSCSLSTILNSTKPSLVLPVNLSLSRLAECLSLCKSLHIPVVSLHVTGPFFMLRMFTGLRTAVETHPTALKFDPILKHPTTGMFSLLEKLENRALDFSLIPWPVLLLFAIKKWKVARDTVKYPTVDDYEELISIVLDYLAGDQINESFVELKAQIFSALETLSLPPVIQQGFSLLTKHKKLSGRFWTLFRCLSLFFEEFGRLPHNGFIPDMNSDPQSFLIIRNDLRSLHESDIQHLLKCYHSLSGSSESETNLDSIISDLTRFSKNIWNLEIKEYPLEFLPVSSEGITSLKQNMWDPNCTKLFGAFIALLKFQDVHHRSPSLDTPSDVVLLASLRSEVEKEFLFNEGDLDDVVTSNWVEELLRGGSNQLHCVGAIAGATTAQEAVKVLTGQFVSLDNTFIWNSIRTVGTTIKL